MTRPRRAIRGRQESLSGTGAPTCPGAPLPVVSPLTRCRHEHEDPASDFRGICGGLRWTTGPPLAPAACSSEHATTAAGRGPCRLLPRARRPAVSAASPVAPFRRCPDAGPSPHSRRRADHVVAAAAPLGVGGASVVGKHRGPFFTQRRDTRPASHRIAAPRHRGARRPRSHEADVGAAFSRAT